MTRVGLVLDLTMGQRIIPLSEVMHVWVIDTPVNRAAVKKVRANQQGESSLRKGATVFQDLEGRTPEAKCEEILNEIEQHHGEHSQTPPYSELEVFGLALSEELQRILEKHGFSGFSETPHGFTAEK